MPVLQSLGATVLQRDWLSANHTVFGAWENVPATVVDTGHVRHAALSLALIDHALAGDRLGRIVNTHLHSDHCGGNAACQSRDATLQTWIPAGCSDAVREWQEAQLSYRYTGQSCDPFRAEGLLHAGSSIQLGPALWQIHAAPGHDPDAVMLFEPQTRTLIAGDALWEDRLAVIFPEIESRPGFDQARMTLDLIESLAPRCVIPGHGSVFEDVPSALAASRRRLDNFQREPRRHWQHAARALLMYHLMELRRQPRAQVEAWLCSTPVFVSLARCLQTEPSRWGRELIDGLLDDGLLALHVDVLTWEPAPAR